MGIQCIFLYYIIKSLSIPLIWKRWINSCTALARARINTDMSAQRFCSLSVQDLMDRNESHTSRSYSPTAVFLPRYCCHPVCRLCLACSYGSHQPVCRLYLTLSSDALLPVRGIYICAHSRYGDSMMVYRLPYCTNHICNAIEYLASSEGNTISTSPFSRTFTGKKGFIFAS